MQSSDVDSAVLERVQAHVRDYAAGQRDVERIGPFLATFGRHSSGPYLNYAVPDDGAEPTPSQIYALIAAYESRRLVPRVELLDGLAPGVTDALFRAGFFVEGEFPLMACSAGALRDVGCPGGLVVALATDDEHIEDLLEVRQAAFEEPDRVTEADIARVRLSIDSGGFAAVAYSSADHEPVGSGASIVPYSGVTELTSIGVKSRWRGRGAGAVVTATLTQAAMLSGVDVVYLTPANDDGKRLYERVGYTTAGKWVHMRH